MKMTHWITASGISACVSSSILTAATDPGVLWETRNLDTARMTLNDVTRGQSDRFIAVGDNGAVLVSEDNGANWTEGRAPVPFNLRAISWAGDRFVAVGGSDRDVCLILQSANGLQWNTTFLGGNPSLEGVAAQSGTTVVVGDNELTAISSDFIRWAAARGSSVDPQFSDVIWAGTQFVAVGFGGMIKTSTDGVTWIQRTRGLDETMSFNAVASNESILVAAGFQIGMSGPLIAVSNATGIRWTSVSTTTLPKFRVEAIEWNGSQFVAMGGRHIITSPDGTVWTYCSTPGGAGIRGMCGAKNHLIAVGDGGAIIETYEDLPDEVGDWTVRSASTLPTDINDMISVGLTISQRRVVMVGDGGTVLSSDDDLQTITTQNSGTNKDLNGVSSYKLSGAEYVAVGAQGTIITSPDAAAWTAQNSGTTRNLHSIAWFQSGLIAPMFLVAVGDGGTMLASSSTISWTPITSPTTENLRDIALDLDFNNNTHQMAAVGDNGTILHSSDGQTWSMASNSATSEHLHGVDDLVSGFVAVGANGTVITSGDGNNWTSQSSGTTATLLDVVWTGKLVIATGEDGLVITSPDGVHWTRRHPPCVTDLRCVERINANLAAAAGEAGVIITSGPAPDFNDWIAAQSPPPGQDGPDDDPNHDGVSNLLACALDIPAVAPPDADDFARLLRAGIPGPDWPMLVGLRPMPIPVGDIAYIIETSPTMEPGSWTEALRRLPGQACGTGQIDVSIPVSGEEMLLMFPETIGCCNRYFTRLRVEQTP